MGNGKKKFCVLVFLVLLMAVFASFAFASDYKFVLGELAQHPEILYGFCPTLTTVGVSYEGLELIDVNLTQIQLIAGGGYAQLVLFQDPKTGEPLFYNQGIYDSIQMRWNLKMLQGFGSSWVEGKDLLTVYFGYEGRFEKNIDSIAVGKERKRGYTDDSMALGASKISKLDDWFSGFGVSRASKITDNTIYPNLFDGDTAFMNSFYLGVRLNGMDDRMVSNEGVLAKVELQFAPAFLNKKASYYSITFNVVAGTTLYELQDSSTGRNTFSVVMLDRVNINWTNGSLVPVYAQQSVSLGRKVRGFNTGSYNTNFTIVNNFDIRLAGPEPLVDGIFPRINLFFDMGYHGGDYFNTKISAQSMIDKYGQEYGLNRFLCSTGFQLEVSFFDFFDLGLQVSYLINGRNLRDPGSNIITGATFFLDF